ncbi:MAG: RNA methyltransferase [Anaerolineae bacterium]|nr:RNA methyltransferase [Anaerolineae bacterium]
MITSVHNRRVIEARKLTQRKYRQAQGRFLVEGYQLLHLALDSGIHPVEVFYCPRRMKGQEAISLLQRFGNTGAQIVAVSEVVIDTLSQREGPQGIIAAFTPFDVSLEALTLRRESLILVLDRPQSPGNIGTLIRTADAVGAAAVILIEPCADVFDPRAVRGSMGALFTVPLVRVSDVRIVCHWLRRQSVRLVGADPGQGCAWGQGLWQGSVALILGNEARGLSGDICSEIEAWARLPIVGQADSLNVAVAGGVLMYAWLQEHLAA